MNAPKQPPMLDAIREFLRDRPEYVAGTKTAVVDGVEEVLLTTDTVIAFSEWSIAKGYTRDAAKARRFTAWLADPDRLRQGGMQ